MAVFSKYCMCIVIGKYFDDHGWVAIKNRDRNYIPEISFKKRHKGGVEELFFWDDVTDYSEGLNSAGVGILSASLAVQDDEKEIDKSTRKHSPDGKKIRKALQYPSAKAAAMSLIKDKLPGNTLIFDENTMYLLEGSWRPGEYDTKGYSYKIREIPKDHIVVRTNHGIWLNWAGYQRDPRDRASTLSRISSESRWLIAEAVVEEADTPEDILDGLTFNFTNHGQLNALRTSTKSKKMRTTAQIMIIPKERTMYVRPVQSHISFNFWDLNNPKQQTWIEIMSNRILYKNLKDDDPSNDPPFAHGLNHVAEDDV